MATTSWPSLRVSDWTATRDTLHMWTQIVGKIRMAHAPMVNHWWQVTLYVDPRGLTTSAVPYRTGAFEIAFDFVGHRLEVRSSDGGERGFPLRPMPVAEFYAQVLHALDALGIEAPIRPYPNEVEPAIPFAEDHDHASYDGDAAALFWRQLLQAHRVMGEFRSHFVGKVSPVHFFWGAMDLACTRFSGRKAPPHPGGAPNCGDWVMVEGYSRELSSCGFWPGGERKAPSTPMPIPRRTDSPTTRSDPKVPTSAPSSSSSSFPTRPSAPPPTPTTRSPSSSAPPTKPPPCWGSGIAPCSRTTPAGGTEPPHRAGLPGDPHRRGVHRVAAGPDGPVSRLAPRGGTSPAGRPYADGWRLPPPLRTPRPATQG